MADAAQTTANPSAVESHEDRNAQPTTEETITSVDDAAAQKVGPESTKANTREPAPIHSDVVTTTPEHHRSTGRSAGSMSDVDLDSNTTGKRRRPL